MFEAEWTLSNLFAGCAGSRKQQSVDSTRKRRQFALSVRNGFLRFLDDIVLHNLYDPIYHTEDWSPPTEEEVISIRAFEMRLTIVSTDLSLFFVVFAHFCKQPDKNTYSGPPTTPCHLPRSVVLMGNHGNPVQLDLLTMDRSDERESKLKWYETPILPKHRCYGRFRS